MHATLHHSAQNKRRITVEHYINLCKEARLCHAGKSWANGNKYKSYITYFDSEKETYAECVRPKLVTEEMNENDVIPPTWSTSAKPQESCDCFMILKPA